MILRESIRSALRQRPSNAAPCNKWPTFDSFLGLPQTIAAKEDRKQKHDPGNTIPNSVADERGYQTNGTEKCRQKRDAEYLPDGFSSNARTDAGHEVSTGSFDPACVAASILSTLETD